MKKSSRRFVISTDVENSNKFSVSTAGIDTTGYALNPLMLWMHKRPKGERRDEILPLGNFLDLEYKDGKLYGTPAFDTTDTFAVSIMNKVENGTIRMASAGLLPIEWDRDADGRLWLTRSRMVEISLCDIGSNPEALSVALYDENENLINLSEDFIQALIPNQIKNADMKFIQLSADMLPLIGLAEGAKPEEAQAKIQELVTLANDQKTTIASLTSEKESEETKRLEAETKLADQIKLAEDEKVIGLVDAAVTARKITADQKESYVKLAKADYETTKSLLDGIKPSPAVVGLVNDGNAQAAEEYTKLSWEELDKSGKLIALKRDHVDLFKSKFKEKFGIDYKG